MAEEIVDIGYIDLSVGPDGGMTRGNRFAEATDVETLMRYVVGAGSMCWTDVRRAGTFETEDANAIADDAAARARELLATVRPDPDSDEQVEVVARTLCIEDCGDPDESMGGTVYPSLRRWHGYQSRARAVLTALAEAVA